MELRWRRKPRQLRLRNEHEFARLWMSLHFVDSEKQLFIIGGCEAAYWMMLFLIAILVVKNGSFFTYPALMDCCFRPEVEVFMLAVALYWLATGMISDTHPFSLSHSISPFSLCKKWKWEERLPSSRTREFSPQSGVGNASLFHKFFSESVFQWQFLLF